MRTRPYDRQNAVTYAHRWAFSRNPQYYDYQNLGGDCTNFASQVVYAGAGVMNYTPAYGWYYRSLNDHAPGWTGVPFLYRFLVNNRGVGPVATQADLPQAMPGDVIQLSFNGVTFTHSPVVVAVGAYPDASNILVAAHTFDADNRSLDSYIYERARLLHITHVNVW